MSSKRKRPIRNGIRVLWVFFFFHFGGLKLVLIDSALNFASGNQLIFFQKCRCGTKKSRQTWENRIKIFLEYPLWSIAAKLKKIGIRICLQEVEQESSEWNRICQILISLTLLTSSCFLAKKAQILQYCKK